MTERERIEEEIFILERDRDVCSRLVGSAFNNWWELLNNARKLHEMVTQLRAQLAVLPLASEASRGSSIEAEEDEALPEG